ncbi:MAG: hypothetical protein U5R30_12745 [Deltaproteobacteria bacterium]|nr:hypothetical protein [Deltaproteobacteria bacterium]
MTDEPSRNFFEERSSKAMLRRSLAVLTAAGIAEGVVAPIYATRTIFKSK